MADENVLKNAIIESAAEAFETTIMLGIEPTDTPDEVEDLASCAAGSITFTGPIQGALVVHCSKDISIKITKSMLMMEDDEEADDSEVKDAIGEVVNLVLGGLKSRIAESHGEIDISVPTIVTGQKIRPTLGVGAKTIEIFEKTDSGTFSIILTYKQA